MRGRLLWASVAVLLCGSSLATATKLKSPITSDHMKVYVAELDPVLNFRTLLDYDVRRFFTQFGADPIGVWSNPIGDWVTDRDDMELRNTYMYGLDIMFHRQLLQSPLRVHSYEEADVVFIPIYADIGCRLAQENATDKANWRAATDRFWGEFPDKFPDVKTKPHFIVTGRREAENMGGCGMDGVMYGKVEPCNFLCHPYAADLIMLTVEVLAGNLEVMGPKPLRPTSVPVPWPGHWHFSLGSPYFKKPFEAAAHAASKQYLAMESLRVRLPLRELLFKSCTERSDACLHYQPRGRISHFNQSEIYGVVKSAWYCIQPPGDGPTRHATMDCLAAGSLPLFFDEHITAVMPFSDILDYAEFTEYIDPNLLVETQANAIDILEAAFEEEAALKAARRLHQVKHVFLYAINPEHSLLRFSEMYSLHPWDDAFTASMKALLRKACQVGTLSKERCPQEAAERAAASATASTAAPQALNRGASASPGGAAPASAASSGAAATDASETARPQLGSPNSAKPSSTGTTSTVTAGSAAADDANEAAWEAGASKSSGQGAGAGSKPAPTPLELAAQVNDEDSVPDGEAEMAPVHHRPASEDAESRRYARRILSQPGAVGPL